MLKHIVQLLAFKSFKWQLNEEFLRIAQDSTSHRSNPITTNSMQPKTLFLIKLKKKKKRCLGPGKYLSNFHTTKEIGPLALMDLTHFDTEN